MDHDESFAYVELTGASMHAESVVLRYVKTSEGRSTQAIGYAADGSVLLTDEYSAFGGLALPSSRPTVSDLQGSWGSTFAEVITDTEFDEVWHRAVATNTLDYKLTLHMTPNGDTSSDCRFYLRFGSSGLIEELFGRLVGEWSGGFIVECRSISFHDSRMVPGARVEVWQNADGHLIARRIAQHSRMQGHEVVNLEDSDRDIADVAAALVSMGAVVEVAGPKQLAVASEDTGEQDPVFQLLATLRGEREKGAQ